MRGGEEDDHHHHNKHIHNFLPMFCRLSLNDVKPNNHRYKIPITPSAGGGDPGSPKVSCIGQVKRNSRVVGFPAAASHHKHRKPFSAKTLPLLPNTALGGSRSCRANITRSVKVLKDNSNNISCDHRDCGIYKIVQDIGQMDPPLPVVKRTAAAAASVAVPENTLWKRRGKNSNGLEIERLKIEEIKLGNNGRFRFQISPPTTA